MIKKIKVRMFKEILLCDSCGEEMKATGVTLMSYPPQYPHGCICGETATFFKKYPQIVYEEVKEEEVKDD